MTAQQAALSTEEAELGAREAAVAYAVAERLGFTQDQVEWTVAPFNQTYKPGPTAWDFAIEQISFSEKRAQAVDFSDSYYDVNQALIANNGTPAASATSIADLADLSLAAPIGTTSYDFIVNTIMPTQEAGAFSTLADTVAALAAGQVDAIVEIAVKDQGIGNLHLRFLGEWAGETRYVCEESAELFAKEVMPRFADDVPVKKPAIEPAE